MTPAIPLPVYTRLCDLSAATQYELSAVECLEKLVEGNSWYSVNERLPKDQSWVYVYREGEIHVAWFGGTPDDYAWEVSKGWDNHPTWYRDVKYWHPRVIPVPSPPGAKGE